MVKFTFRIPTELVTKIDEKIETEKRYSTRPDFVISAVRNTIWMFSEHRAQVIGMMKNDVRLKEVADYLPKISTTIGDVLIRQYDGYGVKTIPVLITMPDGLEELLLNTIKTLNICDTKTEFLQMAIISELENNLRVDKILSNAEKFVEEEREKKKRLLEEAVNSLLEGKSEDLMGEVISSLFNSARPINDKPKQ